MNSLNIERANSVLSQAILNLQTAESDAMFEAMAVGLTSYNVPRPARTPSSYMPPSPKDLAPVEPKGGSRDLKERVRFTRALSKQIKNLKKDMKKEGVSRVYQGYKGTGGKADNLQIFVDFKGQQGVYGGLNIDMFISPGYVKLGGVLHHRNGGTVPTRGRSVKEVYQDVLKLMRLHVRSVSGAAETRGAA